MSKKKSNPIDRDTDWEDWESLFNDLADPIPIYSNYTRRYRDVGYMYGIYSTTDVAALVTHPRAKTYSDNDFSLIQIDSDNMED